VRPLFVGGIIVGVTLTAFVLYSSYRAYSFWKVLDTV